MRPFIRPGRAAALAAAGKTRCPECGGALDSRPSSVVAASLRAYRARSRRDAAVERDDVVVAKGRPLGRGSHGVVKKAHWRGKPVAVKQVPLDDDEAAVAMQRELKALRALRHPNVVALLGALTLLPRLIVLIKPFPAP